MPHRCAFGCKHTDSGVVMHMFPNPKKFPEHFHAWVNLLGGKFETLSDHEIYTKKRICDIHFTDGHRNRFKRLNALAMPTLYLPDDISSITKVVNCGMSRSESAIPAVILQPYDTNTGEPNHIPLTNAVLPEHNYSAISKTSRNMLSEAMPQPQPSTITSSWSVAVPRKKWNKNRRERQRRSRTLGRQNATGLDDSEPETQGSKRYTTEGCSSMATSGGTGIPTGGNQCVVKPVQGVTAPVKSSSGPAGSSSGSDSGHSEGGDCFAILTDHLKQTEGSKGKSVTGVRAAQGTKGGPSGHSHGTARPMSASGKSTSGLDPLRKTQNTKATTSRANQSQSKLTRPRVNSGTSEGETLEGGSPKSNKRDRLDDSISPKVVLKRLRTYRPIRESETSYAPALNPRLNVAITTNPRIDLSEIESTAIKDQLQKAIFETLNTQLASPTESHFAPEFRGQTFLQDGVVKLKVADDETLAWLRGIVPTMKAPREGYSLTLIEQRQIRPKIKATLYVPDYQGDVDFLHKLLIWQNRKYYNIDSWQFTHYDICKGYRPGMLLHLGIPSEEIPKILKEGRRINFSHGSIYIRFIPEGQTDTIELYSSPKDNHIPQTSTDRPDRLTGGQH